MIFGLVAQREVITKKFEVQIPDKLVYESNYNLRAGQDCLFLGSHRPTEFTTMRFGMVPFWMKEERAFYEAPVEGSSSGGGHRRGIILDPVYRKPIREQRGLLPVDYFIVESQSGTPYLVFLKDRKQRPMGLACVWDGWKKEMTDELNFGFSVLTTPAYGKFAELGLTRMPLILYEGFYRKWVKNQMQLSQITQMFYLYEDRLLDAFPVAPEILSNRANEKYLIEAKGPRIDPPEPPYIPQKVNNWFQSRKKMDDNSPSWGERRNGS